MLSVCLLKSAPELWSSLWPTTCFNRTRSFLSWGPHNWTLYSRKNLKEQNHLPQPHFLSSSLWMASCPSGTITPPFILVSTTNLLRMYMIPSSVSMIKLGNTTAWYLSWHGIYTLNARTDKKWQIIKLNVMDNISESKKCLRKQCKSSWLIYCKKLQKLPTSTGKRNRKPEAGKASQLSLDFYWLFWGDCHLVVVVVVIKYWFNSACGSLQILCEAWGCMYKGNFFQRNNTGQRKM